MSIIDNNITEEEKISGYNPNEVGDETFALEKLDSYPGVLPDFSYVEEPIIPGESLFQDDEELEVFDNEEDFGDLKEDIEDYDEANFDFGDDDDSLNSEESLDEIPSESSFAGAFEDSDETFDSFSEFSNQDEENDSVFNNDDNDDNIQNQSDEDDSGIETLSDDEIKALEGNSANEPEGQQGIELDDALKGLVEAELQRSSGRASQEFNFDEYQESVPRDDFPIDDDLSANVMNFNEIDADKPSNYGINKLPDEEENKKEDVKKEDKKPEKKKSSKKMIYIYSGVAATLLITLLTIAIFNKDTLFDNIGDETDSTLVENVIEDSNNSKSITKVESKNQENKAIKDIAKVNENDNSKSISDELNSNTETKVEEKIDDKIAQNETQEINLPNEVDNKQDNPKKINSLSPKLKSNDKKEFTKLPNEEDKIQEDKKAITKSTNNRKTNKKKITENKDIAKNNTEKATITKSSEVNNNVAYPKKEKSDEGLFIVQIYASQSKEDANYWLNKLKNQNINDAFISEQIVRDEVWYRVRFGSFVTKSEAMETASKLGYAQTWVDRVK